MRKFDLYAKRCGECVYKVTEALHEDTLLSKEEFFDYFFKAKISGVEIPSSYKKNKNYSYASFYAIAFMKMDCLRALGFSFKEVIKVFRELKYLSKVLVDFSIPIKLESYDMDGVLYIVVSVNYNEYTFEIKDARSMSFSILAFATWVVICNIEEDNYVDFLTEYLPSVYNDICKGVSPKPYVSNHVTKNLRRYLSKENKSSSNKSKVIDLKEIVGGL